MLKLLEEIKKENLRIFGFGKDFLSKNNNSALQKIFMKIKRLKKKKRKRLSYRLGVNICKNIYLIKNL